GTVTHNMWVMKSTDNGATFGPPVPLTLPGQQAWLDLQCADSGGPSSLAVNKTTGRIYAFWCTRYSASGGCASQPLEVTGVGATAWYLHVSRSYDAMTSLPHIVDDTLSDIPTYTGTASALMGACGSGPLAGIENGLACGRSTDVWGITLDRECHVHVVWPS